MISILILTIGLLLDGLLSNFFPFVWGNLSYFTPMFTLTSLFFIYPLLPNKKQYFVFSFLFGVLFDLAYTHLLIVHGILFVLVALLVQKIYHMFSVRSLLLFFYLALVIAFHEGLFFFLLSVARSFSIPFWDYFYKVSHSIIGNVLYGYILYGILKLFPSTRNRFAIH